MKLDLWDRAQAVVLAYETAGPPGHAVTACPWRSGWASRDQSFHRRTPAFSCGWYSRMVGELPPGAYGARES